MGIRHSQNVCTVLSVWQAYTSYSCSLAAAAHDCPNERAELEAAIYDVFGYCPTEEKFRAGVVAEGTNAMVRDALVDLLTKHGVPVERAHEVSAYACILLGAGKVVPFGEKGAACFTQRRCAFDQCQDQCSLFGVLRSAAGREREHWSRTHQMRSAAE